MAGFALGVFKFDLCSLSAILLAFTRPFVIKKLKQKSKKSYLLEGKEITVTKAVARTLLVKENKNGLLGGLLQKMTKTLKQVLCVKS